MAKAGKQKQAKPDESAELAQALMRCAGTGIYIVQDGKFRYVNALFQELTGYSELELLGKYSLDLVHPEDRETVRKKATESLKVGSPLSYEYRFVKKDGEIIWVLEKVTSTEYKGKRVADFLHPDDKAIVLEKFAEGLTRPEAEYQLEFRAIHKDGRVVWIYPSVSPIFYKDVLSAGMSIVFDITERKQLEE